jgi:hypothetical protein
MITLPPAPGVERVRVEGRKRGERGEEEGKEQGEQQEEESEKIKALKALWRSEVLRGGDGGLVNRARIVWRLVGWRRLVGWIVFFSVYILILVHKLPSVVSASFERFSSFQCA